MVQPWHRPQPDCCRHSGVLLSSRWRGRSKTEATLRQPHPGRRRTGTTRFGGDSRAGTARFRIGEAAGLVQLDSAWNNSHEIQS